jgi:hypothetical protein
MTLIRVIFIWAAAALFLLGFCCILFLNIFQTEEARELV